jgi:hypothetical protein
VLLDDVTMTWFGLRARRFSLPARSKLSETNARAQTFAAAMTQFEEQYSAAKVVTEFTRPLNLYYGLAQAGMAIAAAHAPDPWSFSRHGLRLGNRNAELTDMTIGPEGEGGFQRVAAAVGSPVLTAPVSLGALWASLPGLSEVGPLSGSASPLPIPLLSSESLSRWPQATLFLPDNMPTERPAWLERFDEIRAAYPGAAECAIPAEGDPISPPDSPGDKWAVDVRWPAQDASKDMSVEELGVFFDNIAPAYRYRSDRYLRPAIDGNTPPSSLMTWWLLLYSFSILARYEPRRWTKLLDPDKTETAVLLQYALAEALTAVPHLVLEALDRKPYLLPKPMAF